MSEPFFPPDDHEHESDTEEVSKSQRKREAHALQELGVNLVALPPAQLADIPMSDDLRRAIEHAKSIRAHGGLKRQYQYIGKLMRREDVEPIQEAMERLRLEKTRQDARLHTLERWRDRLVEEGDAALADLLDENPTLDRQHLRQLIRNAQKEKRQDKPPKSARELFRYLRESLD